MKINYTMVLRNPAKLTDVGWWTVRDAEEAERHVRACVRETDAVAGLWWEDSTDDPGIELVHGESGRLIAIRHAAFVRAVSGKKAAG